MCIFWIFSLLIATVRVVASLNISSSHAEYYFLTHTFSDLSCDPYTNETSSSLALECSVLGSRITPTSSFKIVWYRTLENTNTNQNLNNLYTNQSELVVMINEQKIAVSTIPEKVIVRSVLTVASLNTNNVSGAYWCTVEQDQMKVLMSENPLVAPLTLQPSSVYQGLEACPEGVIHTAVANNTITHSTSSPSYSFTTPTLLTTTSSLSSSTSTIENISNKNEQSVNSYKLYMTRIIGFSVTIGMLVFAVHILLVIIGCLCCGGEKRRSKGKKEIFPFHRSAISHVSSSCFIGRDHILPTISSPTLPLTQITYSGPFSPPGITLTKPPNHPPPQMKPPPPKMKPPPLPLWSTLPSHQKILVPSPDTDFQDTNAYRKRAATVSSEMSYCYACHKKPKFIDIARMCVAKTKQDQFLISPLSSKGTNDIYASPISMSHGRSTLEHNSTISTVNSRSDATANINQGTYTAPDINLASLSFTNKYKSLILETMDGCPVYQYPTHAISSDESDEDGDNKPEIIQIKRNEQVKLAMEYARLHLMNDVMSEGDGLTRVSAMVESMDGDYVLPNEFVWTVTTSQNNAKIEQPDYISLS